MRIIEKRTNQIAVAFWLCLAACLASAAASVPEFTPEEKAWLATKPVLLVGVDPFWPPYSTVGSQGRLSGIDGDILELIAKRTGIRFTIVKSGSWAEAEQLAREGKVDVLTGTAQTPERMKFAKFTRPYVPSAMVIITRKNNVFLTSLRELEGRSVAVPREHVIANTLADDFPGIKLTYTNTQAEALRKVARGAAEASVGNLTSANHIILSEGLGGLKIAGMTDYAFDIRLAVIAPGPAHAVLDKTLASIPRHETAEIVDRWTGVEFQRGVSSRSVWRALAWAGGIAAFIVLAFVLRNRSLAHELAERRKVERALSEANEALRFAGEEKGALMQMLAHDLNGALSVLTMLGEIFRRRVSRDASALEEVNMMQSSVEKMSRLIRDLLSADAVEKGKRQFVLRAMNPADTLRSVVERLHETAAAKRIDLRLQTGEACPVCADELALDQIVENLLSNAIKFTPKGGAVEVSLRRSDGAAEICVADTGPGVPEQERSLLFRKFSRLSAQPTGGESSHGLGLMMVKSLVEAMHGDIRHEARTSGGSVFIVRLRM